jgi:hypothetical protein
MAIKNNKITGKPFKYEGKMGKNPKIIKQIFNSLSIVFI